MADVKRVLERQLGIAWALLDYHVQQWYDDDLFWEPAPTHWTMHRVQGVWVPDWAEVEPSPVPAPTIAWLTWHIGWWWSTALAHLEQTDVPSREDVVWPGTCAAVAEWLGSIHEAWRAALSATDRLDEESAFPWPAGSGFSVADLCAWVNVELMKNAAEIGQLLILRRAEERPA
jgi:hypothetical protein